MADAVTAVACGDTRGRRDSQHIVGNHRAAGIIQHDTMRAVIADVVIGDGRIIGKAHPNARVAVAFWRVPGDVVADEVVVNDVAVAVDDVDALLAIARDDVARHDGLCAAAFQDDTRATIRIASTCIHADEIVLDACIQR